MNFEEMQQRACAVTADYDYDNAKKDTWDAMLSAGVFVEGDFTFASGIHATLKADAEVLYSRPQELELIMGHFATYPCVQDADVLLYVPDGMRKFVTALGERLQKPVAHTIRRPDATTKYDFIFKTAEDEELAISANRPLIGEDVVTTLGSVAALRSLLPETSDVHSLAMLLRGTVKDEYRRGLTDHYLLVREIPTDKDEFQRKLKEEWAN